MKRNKSLVAAALCAAMSLPIAASATGQAKAGAPPDKQPPQAIQAWMECEECREGQRQAVARLGAAAVPLLGEYLRSGPPAEKRELAIGRLQAAYRNMKEYEAGHPEAKVTMTLDEYVATYLGNYLALYQSRAATALADIGGAEATRLLEQALQADLREDVKAAVRNHLERIKKR